MKVVINRCYGGFGLSSEANKLYCERKGYTEVYEWEIDRNDPVLVEIVEELGESANGYLSELKIVEIPDTITWYIQEYDGVEEVHETHGIWA